MQLNNSFILSLLINNFILMHILVQTITNQQQEFSNVTSLEDLQNQIEASMHIPIAEQKLLINSKSASTSELYDNCLVNLIISIEGGAKGKKKKKDTKKTKKKHHKRKVNLAILKYYKVENGKVVRLRQMCKVCPPGTFIAEHQDRLYCGRCRTAYDKVVENTGKKGGEKKEKGKKGKK